MKKYIAITAFFYLMLSLAFGQPFKYYGSDNQPETHSVGIAGGVGRVMGDLEMNGGFQLGPYYQYHFARWLDARVGFTYCKYKGLSTSPTPIASNDALNGDRDSTLNYADSTHNSIFYPNYQMTALDIAITGKLHVIEMFSKTYNKPLTVYVMGGVGVFSYVTKMNARDNNNALYNFQTLSSPTSSAIKAMLDNTYESDAEYNSTNTITPFVQFGGGVRYRIGEHLGVALEATGKYNSDDLLDGFQWKSNTGLSDSKDLLGNVNLCIEWIF